MPLKYLSAFDFIEDLLGALLDELIGQTFTQFFRLVDGAGILGGNITYPAYIGNHGFEG